MYATTTFLSSHSVALGRKYGPAHYTFKIEVQLSRLSLADLYKARWDIEIFFRNLKQNFHIKSFVGTSSNAVEAKVIYIQHFVSILGSSLYFFVE